MSRRLLQDERGRVQIADEPSPRNTAEIVRSLFLLRRGGVSCPIDAEALHHRLLTAYLSNLEYPDVALVLLADAAGGGANARVLGETLVNRMPRRASETMYLSWVLRASVVAWRTVPACEPLRVLAQRVARRIMRNQVRGTGLFRASAERFGWLRRRRGSVATIPVQVAAMHALATYGAVCDDANALARARRCADTVRTLQGERGQWWWSHDVTSGRVVRRYPVYAVVQDATMPEALAAAAGGTRRRIDGQIARGVAWVFGENEIAESLVDEGRAVIWRALDGGDDGYRIVREMYSYHPARCLSWLASCPVSRPTSAASG